MIEEMNLYDNTLWFLHVSDSNSTFWDFPQPHLANYGGKMIQVYGPQLWNSLPKEIHDSTSLDTFKNKIKSYYVAQYDL